MADKILTIEEIKNLFPDEWILLSLPNDATAQNDKGVVLFHSKDYLEFSIKVVK
jgi:hypothetical protein